MITIKRINLDYFDKIISLNIFYKGVIKIHQPLSTKDIILDASIDLFSSLGYESTSMRNIANDSNIKSSSIYNHFKSKDEILDEIYSYFHKHAHCGVKPIEYMKEYIKYCTPLEFIQNLHFKFDKEGVYVYKKMTLIMKLIYTRLFVDDKAKYILNTTLGSFSITYTADILDYGISIGRVEPLNTKIFASCLNGQLHMMGIRAFTDPTHTIEYVKEEEEIEKLYASMLIFKPMSI